MTADPVFVSHFLLTYRRFATPRSILLAMQKRMRALDQPNGDPMFACYAQMRLAIPLLHVYGQCATDCYFVCRICLLLDNWIHAYPSDFAVPGAAGALSALVKSILTKTYLLHYGAELLPFLEAVPNLRDRDQSWALKVDEDNDSLSLKSDEEGCSTLETASTASSKASRSLAPSQTDITKSQGPSVTTRDRKSSLPLTAKALVMGSTILSPINPSEAGEHTARYILKRLVGISEELQKVPYKDIAVEITRIEVRYFLQIKVRSSCVKDHCVC